MAVTEGPTNRDVYPVIRLMFVCFGARIYTPIKKEIAVTSQVRIGFSWGQVLRLGLQARGC